MQHIFVDLGSGISYSLMLFSCCEVDFYTRDICCCFQGDNKRSFPLKFSNTLKCSR